MIKKGLISVVVPVYNAELYLKKCIQSIINQTYKKIEIIIINDGSTDNSIDICKDFIKKDKRIKLVNIDNQGVANARNMGLKNVTGEYVCFVDSDDYISNDYIEIMYNTIQKNKIDIVECNYFLVDEKNNIFSEVILGDYNSSNNYKISKDFLRKINFTNTLWNKMFKYELIKDIHFENFKTSEDYCFLANLFLKVNNKLNIPNKLYYYRQNQQGICNKPFSINTLDVIYAREKTYELYAEKGYQDLSLFVASRILFYVYMYYKKIKELNKDERLKVKTELKRLYKKYYKQVLKLEVRTDGKKFSKKELIFRKIQFYSFLCMPCLSYLLVDVVQYKNKKRKI